MKKALLIALLLMAPAFASAQNVGQCGWGSKLFDGQRGIAPQVLAVTTNGSTYNQTVGITFGTSGCTQNGVVRSSWRTAAFIDGNMNRLAKAAARGEGESLDSLAALVGVNENDSTEFKSLMQENFTEIFAADASTESVYDALKVALTNSDLNKYSTSL